MKISEIDHINNVQAITKYLLNSDAPEEIIRNFKEIVLYCNLLELDSFEFNEKIKELRTKTLDR